jgi:hypothetical protein
MLKMTILLSLLLTACAVADHVPPKRPDFSRPEEFRARDNANVSRVTSETR